MRLPIIALATAMLVSIVPVVTSAQTAFGVLNVWLKKHESADAPNDQLVTLYQKSKALVIGMDHYGGGWPQLSNGIKDAEEVAKGLTAQGFEVTLKKDLKSEELDRTLKDFFVRDGADVDTRLLLWFAGHGYTVRDEGYIVPVDAPSPTADADFRDKAISLRRFGEYMREANSRHVLAIFDSCFAGAVFNTARSMPPPAITLATTEPVREFISSGEADQQVSDDGMFRKLFLDVLAGKEPDADANHDGYVTGTELGLFLHQKMTNLTNNRQTPRYGKLNALGYDRGDFVFQVGKLDVATVATSTTQPSNDAAQAWAATQSTTSQTVLEDFIKRYRDSFYGTLARARLDELKKNQVAVVAPPAIPTAPAVSSGPCGSAPIAVSLSSRPAQPLSAAEECALKPKDVFKECDNCPEMAVIPLGSFTMGSPSNEKRREDDEGPQHTVTISHALAVGKFMVTVDQFADFVRETEYDAESECFVFKDGDWVQQPDSSYRNPPFSQTGLHPAVCLRWDAAKAYVSWLSKKTGKTYRLLTEAEWEYAARARTRPGCYPRYFFGDNEDDMCRYGNGADQTAKKKNVAEKDWTFFHCSDGYAYTSPVGTFLPNGFGLYDMHGNAQHWLEDCWHDKYDGTPSDASAWTSGNCRLHVIRGGSWHGSPGLLRAAHRYWSNNSANYTIGFRVARTLSP
jgi:formylglycine-generating enzyme required for sulfatase activity